MRNYDTIPSRISKEGTMTGRLDGGFNQQPPPPSYEQTYMNPQATGYTQYAAPQVNTGIPFPPAVAPQPQRENLMGPQLGPCGGTGLSRKQFNILLGCVLFIGMVLWTTYYFFNRQQDVTCLPCVNGTYIDEYK